MRKMCARQFSAACSLLYMLAHLARCSDVVHPCDRPVSGRFFRGGRTAQVQPISTSTRTRPRAVPQLQCLYLLLVVVYGALDRCSLPSPYQHLPARLVQLQTLSNQPHARTESLLRCCAQVSSLVLLMLLMTSSANVQAGELRDGAEAARPVLG